MEYLEMKMVSSQCKIVVQYQVNVYSCDRKSEVIQAFKTYLRHNTKLNRIGG